MVERLEPLQERKEQHCTDLLNNKESGRERQEAASGVTAVNFVPTLSAAMFELLKILNI